MNTQGESGNTYASDALYNTVGNIIYFFCLWIITVLVVRLSGYEDAGILSVAMTTSNMFFVVANYGMRSFQASDITDEYSNQQYILSRYVTVGSGVIMCLIFSAISHYVGVQFYAIQTFMLFKAIEAFSDVLFGVMQRGHQMKFTGISLAAKGLLSVVGFIVGILVTGELIWALILMLVFSTLVLFLYDVPKTSLIDQKAFALASADLSRSFHLLRSCFAMFLVSVAPMILQAIPKLSFERIYSTEELGIYSSVASPTVVLSTLVSCIMIPYLPMFAKAIASEDRKGLFKLFAAFIGLVLIFGILACLATWLFGGWALSFLYGNDMYAYTRLFAWVICSVTLTNLLYCLNALFISGRKIPLLALVYICADIVCYLIAEPLIRARGIYGITDALNITQLLQCIVLGILCIPLFFRAKQKHPFHA